MASAKAPSVLALNISFTTSSFGSKVCATAAPVPPPTPDHSELFESCVKKGLANIVPLTANIPGKAKPPVAIVPPIANPASNNNLLNAGEEM